MVFGVGISEMDCLVNALGLEPGEYRCIYALQFRRLFGAQIFLLVDKLLLSLRLEVTEYTLYCKIQSYCGSHSCVLAICNACRV